MRLSALDSRWEIILSAKPKRLQGFSCELLKPSKLEGQKPLTGQYRVDRFCFANNSSYKQNKKPAI